MTHAHTTAQIRGNVFDPRVAETIARDTHAPLELVRRIYREELEALTRQARLTQFLQVIAARRARLRLRRH